MRLIDQQNGKQPFFLYFASLASHAPYQAPQAAIGKYKSIADPFRRTYSAMLSELGVQVGRIVAELDKKGLRNNTIILFASDNGGATNALFAQGAKSSAEKGSEEGGILPDQKPPASNAPLSGGKGSLREGGVRVVAFANWPGKLKPRIVNEPPDMVDVMPTLLNLAGAKGSADHPFDGKDMWTTIADGAPTPHDDILINVEAFRGAVRKGDWKLIKIALLPGKTQLFNIVKDPGETTDVAADSHKIVKDLEARLIAYAREQKASLWIKAQPAFLGNQGSTIIDPGIRHRRQRIAAWEDELARRRPVQMNHRAYDPQGQRDHFKR